MKLILTTMVAGLIGLIHGEKPVQQKIMAREVVGKVEHRRDTKKDWRAVRVGSSLSQPGTVRTEKESNATLEFEDGTRVILQESSEMTLQQVLKTAQEHGGQIHLEKGRLSFQVKKMTGGRNNYEFSTNTATAAVRGTACNIGSAFGRSIIACSEGEVTLRRAETVNEIQLCSPCIAVQDSLPDFAMRTFRDTVEFSSLQEELFTLLLETKDSDLRGTLGKDSVLLETEVSLRWGWDLPGEENRLLQSRVGDSVFIYAPSLTEKGGVYYAFQEWKVISGEVKIGVPTQSETQIHLLAAGSAEVRAQYLVQSQTLRIQPSPGGRVEGPVVLEIPKGQSRLLRVVADSGYRFVGWESIEGRLQLPTDLKNEWEVMLENESVTIAARFSSSARSIRVLPPVGQGMVDRNLLIGETGAKVLLEAVAGENYFFVEWKLVQGSARIINPNSATTEVELLDKDAEIQPVFASYNSVRLMQVFRNQRLPIQILRGKSGENVTLEVPRTLERAGQTWEFLRWSAPAVMRLGSPTNTRTTAIFAPGINEVEAIFQPQVRKAQWEFFDNSGRKKVLEFEYR